MAPQGPGSQRSNSNRRTKEIRLLRTIAFIVSVIGTGLVCFIVFFLLPKTDGGFNLNARQDPVVKAAIVDQLSTLWPNPAFVKECTAILKDAGYDVDYYAGEDVTVEFYRKLPTHSYKLILLRVHSAYVPKYLSLAMFTSEPYSKQRYVYEQLRNRVASGYIEPRRAEAPRHLVVTDKFVRFSMEGSFDDTVVVMMGCTGIKKCGATAFIEKGATAYIGWDGPVSARHTDQATMQFLRHFVAQRQTVARAVAQTMKDVGHEPKYKSTLLFWPIEAGDRTIQKPGGGLAKTSGWTDKVTES